MRQTSWYSRFSQVAARLSGRPFTFALAMALIVVWVITGPLFQFSDTWQLAMNTVTSIVTFLMVFVIQSTQNRETEAIQLKLDELIRSTKGAHNALLDLEELDEPQLDQLRADYETLARVARKDKKGFERTKTGDGPKS
jgi:low affinity Fe/Cu permease